MSKGNRIRQQHKQEEIDSKKLEALMNIIQSSQFTKKESYLKKKLKMTKRGYVKKLVREIYGFELKYEDKWFRKIAYDTYAECSVLKDFSSFHLLMITKCRIRDNNWKNFITDDGKIRINLV